MLAVKRYEKDYVDACEKQLDAQLAAWTQVKSTPDFERLFFGNLAVVLEMYFVHRMRGLEGKDGNALNEVRMIARSIVAHGSVFTADNTVKYQPEKSILKHQPGDEIRLGEEGFRALATAYFSEIRRKFL